MPPGSRNRSSVGGEQVFGKRHQGAGGELLAAQQPPREREFAEIPGNDDERGDRVGWGGRQLVFPANDNEYGRTTTLDESAGNIKPPRAVMT